jgi:hypothetical protein
MIRDNESKDDARTTDNVRRLNSEDVEAFVQSVSIDWDTPKRREIADLIRGVSNLDISDLEPSTDEIQCHSGIETNQWINRKHKSFLLMRLCA